MDFEAILPEDKEECLAALRRYGDDAALLAGGTDLFVLMKTGAKTPGFVVYVGRIAELKHVGRENGVIRLGAMLTHSEVACLDILAGIDCLTAAAVSVGSPQVRNRGTVGGNIVNASPAGDLYPALLALGANLVLETLDGSREVGLEDFVTGPGITGIKPEEVLTQVKFRKPAGDFFTGFAKIGLRNALAISVANAAVVARSAGGKLKDVRVACGAVAPKPIRMRRVESILDGETPTEDLISEAGRVARSECDPLTDIRATREYRCHVTGVIVSRLVRKACERLLGFGNG
jgi:CO/xanthine dehydrogenase FAD-binding subunit